MLCALADCGRLPDCLEVESLEAPPFETEDAVGAMRDDGRFTGFVGDFGFGFTNPASLAPAWAGAAAGAVFLAAAAELWVGRVADPVARVGPTGLVTGRLAGAAAVFELAPFGVAALVADFAPFSLGREVLSVPGEAFAGTAVESPG